MERVSCAPAVAHGREGHAIVAHFEKHCGPPGFEVGLSLLVVGHWNSRTTRWRRFEERAEARDVNKVSHSSHEWATDEPTNRLVRLVALSFLLANPQPGQLLQLTALIGKI